MTGDALPGFLLVAGGSAFMGVLGGLLGVGGGVFLVPFLIFAADLPPKEAVAVSLCCVIGTSASASFVTARANLPRLDVSLRVEPALIIGAVLASAVGGKLSDDIVVVGFGLLMLVIIGLVQLRRRVRSLSADDDAPLSTRRRIGLVMAAFLSGAASGIFGVGGGVLVVPALALVARLPLRTAAATSSLCLMISASSAAYVHWGHGNLRPEIVAAAIVGVLPGGMIGARLQRRASERHMEIAFTVLALVVAGLSIARGVGS